jgi:hypothetical protein
MQYETSMWFAWGTSAWREHADPDAVRAADDLEWRPDEYRVTAIDELKWKVAARGCIGAFPRRTRRAVDRVWGDVHPSASLVDAFAGGVDELDDAADDVLENWPAVRPEDLRLARDAATLRDALQSAAARDDAQELGRQECRAIAHNRRTDVEAEASRHALVAVDRAPPDQELDVASQPNVAHAPPRFLAIV